MVMNVQTEGDKLVFSSEKLRHLLTLFESNTHIIIIFYLKTDKQKLEKHHVNWSETRILNNGPKSDKRDLLAINVKSKIFTEKERPSCYEQLQKI